jgi:hypothetical protein
MKSLKLTLTLGALAAALTACRDRDLGTGVNTLDREYDKPAAETLKAAVKSVEAAGLKVESQPADQFGGDLVARRAKGDEVRVKVKSLDDHRSLVTVRVEPGDRDLAKLIHERIADHVGLGQAKAGVFGGNSLEGEYFSDPTSCLKTAKRVFEVLQVEPVSEESHATWSRIDGRLKGSTPVRMRMERSDTGKTRVEFIAGNDKNEDNKAFVWRMKEEFESKLRPE